jgi:hypothetical protein
MNKLDTLDRGIGELTNLLSAGWRDIASGGLTSFERREIRNRMVEAAVALRRCLGARDNELRRLREDSRNANGGPRSVQLRFLDTDYHVTIAPVSPAAASASPSIAPASSSIAPAAPAMPPDAASRDGAKQASP